MARALIGIRPPGPPRVNDQPLPSYGSSWVGAAKPWAVRRWNAACKVTTGRMRNKNSGTYRRGWLEDVQALVGATTVQRGVLKSAMSPDADEQGEDAPLSNSQLRTLYRVLKQAEEELLVQADELQRGAHELRSERDQLKAQVAAQARELERLRLGVRLAKKSVKIELAELDWSSLCAAIVDHWTPEAAKAGVSLRFRGGANVRVRADRTHLQQVLVELLSNAVRVTPKGGTILVEVTVVGAFASLIVSDTGAGMRGRPFERIFSGPLIDGEDGQGTGVGLFLVRELLSLLGGHISYQTHSQSRGTSFVARLPVWAPGPTR